MQQVVEALARCSMDTYSLILERMRLDVDGHEVIVAGVRSERAPTVWARLHVEHRIRSDASLDRLRRGIKLTERTCPVSVMLGCRADLTTSLIVVRAVEELDTRPLRQQVLRPHQQEIEMFMPGQDDPGAGFYAAIDDTDRVLVTGAILPSPFVDVVPGSRGEPVEEPSLWRIRGMATDPGRRSGGLGSMVLAALMAHAAERGGKRIWASVRMPAVGFYRKAGFLEVSDVFATEHIGPHVHMARALGD